MTGIQGSATIRPRPNEVVIDLRGRPEPSTGRGWDATIGASSEPGPRIRSLSRLQPAFDLILAAWFGIPAISTGGEPGATPAAGRVCGGNSPTKSSDRPSLGRGS